MASMATGYQSTIPSPMRKTYPRTSTHHLAASRERTRSDRYSDRGRGRRRDGYDERVGRRTFDNAEDDAHFDYDDAINYQSDSNSHHVSDESSPDKPEEKASTFYSRKSLTDPSFSDDPHFYNLCNAAGLTRPSRIQSLAWPVLARGENAIVAGETKMISQIKMYLLLCDYTLY
jgi:hypothetical protein